MGAGAGRQGPLDVCAGAASSARRPCGAPAGALFSLWVRRLSSLCETAAGQFRQGRPNGVEWGLRERARMRAAGGGSASRHARAARARSTLNGRRWPPTPSGTEWILSISDAIWHGRAAARGRAGGRRARGGGLEAGAGGTAVRGRGGAGQRQVPACSTAALVAQGVPGQQHCARGATTPSRLSLPLRPAAARPGAALLPFAPHPLHPLLDHQLGRALATLGLAPQRLDALSQQRLLRTPGHGAQWGGHARGDGRRCGGHAGGDALALPAPWGGRRWGGGKGSGVARARVHGSAWPAAPAVCAVLQNRGCAARGHPHLMSALRAAAAARLASRSASAACCIRSATWASAAP